MSVGIGIVGLGRWAGVHTAAASRVDSIHIASCFSRDESRRSEFAATHGIPSTASSYEALLDDPEVEAIVISTPNDLHVNMAIAAITAGKPVLIDKPVSVDIPSGLALLRAVANGGPGVGVAHHPRRLAGHRAAQHWLQSDDGGLPRLAHADFSNARGAHLSPDAWHRNVPGSEAGVLIQVGIHQIDNMLTLLGPPVAVNARFDHRTLGPMPDAAIVVIQHASGAMSTVTSSWTTPGLYRFELQATGGNLRYRLAHKHWTSADVDDHGELTLSRDGEVERRIDLPKGDPLAEQLAELGAATVERDAMKVDVAAGLRSMAVVLAAVRSSEERGAEVGLADLLRESGASNDEVELLTKGSAGRTS
jgi:predicted dehydrogenase